MSGNSFKVTEAEMVRFSGKIGTVSETIQGEIRHLNMVVDNITSGWKGQAANSYNRLQSQVNEDATRINQLLREIKEAIDETTKNYSASEEEQNAAFNNVGSQHSGPSSSPFG